MAWISTAVSNWARCADFLGPTGQAHDTVNAISIDNLYHFHPPALIPDPSAIAAHRDVFQKAGFRTYPMIGFGVNISELRVVLKDPTTFIDQLVNESVKNAFDGINIDFEPRVDVLHPDNNPTVGDAMAFAELLGQLGTQLHTVGKTLSVDTMAVTGACWSRPPHAKFPEQDLKPCPWIRRFWDLNALSATGPLDRIISMDTYTANSTEYPSDLKQYQYFFPIERIGIGLCPLGCSHPQPTAHCVSERILAAVNYGANELDLWSLWDSTAHSWEEVAAAWQPWIQPLRDFLAGVDRVPSGLCWNETSLPNEAWV